MGYFMRESFKFYVKGPHTISCPTGSTCKTEQKIKLLKKSGQMKQKAKYWMKE